MSASRDCCSYHSHLDGRIPFTQGEIVECCGFSATDWPIWTELGLQSRNVRMLERYVQEEPSRDQRVLALLRRLNERQQCVECQEWLRFVCGALVTYNVHKPDCELHALIQELEGEKGQ